MFDVDSFTGADSVDKNHVREVMQAFRRKHAAGAGAATRGTGARTGTRAGVYDNETAGGSTPAASTTTTTALTKNKFGAQASPAITTNSVASARPLSSRPTVTMPIAELRSLVAGLPKSDPVYPSLFKILLAAEAKDDETNQKAKAAAPTQQRSAASTETKFSFDPFAFGGGGGSDSSAPVDETVQEYDEFDQGSWADDVESIGDFNEFEFDEQQQGGEFAVDLPAHLPSAAPSRWSPRVLTPPDASMRLSSQREPPVRRRLDFSDDAVRAAGAASKAASDAAVSVAAESASKTAAAEAATKTAAAATRVARASAAASAPQTAAGPTTRSRALADVASFVGAGAGAGSATAVAQRRAPLKVSSAALAETNAMASDSKRVESKGDVKEALAAVKPAAAVAGKPAAKPAAAKGQRPPCMMIAPSTGAPCGGIITIHVGHLKEAVQADGVLQARNKGDEVYCCNRHKASCIGALGSKLAPLAA